MDFHSIYNESFTFTSSGILNISSFPSLRYGGFVPLYYTMPWDEDHVNERRWLEFALDGCELPDNRFNCTETCLDPKYAFQDVPTMRNCLMYPLISEALEERDLTQYERDLAIGHGFINAPLVDLSTIKTLAFTCFNSARPERPDCTDWYQSQYLGVSMQKHQSL